MQMLKSVLLHNPNKITALPSFFHRPHSTSPLSLLFQNAVISSQNTQTITETQTTQNNPIKNQLWELEKEINDLKFKEAQAKKEAKKENKTLKRRKKTVGSDGLYSLFTGKSGEKMKREDMEVDVDVEESGVLKELSADMEMLVSYLYKEGYFRDANFLKGDVLDFSCFDDWYGRNFIKFAAIKFGQDHQDIAKWLSGSDLKKVALFGCPSVARKNVFSAKRLRSYFDIQENTVCSKCVLKNSCKFMNQNVWKDDTKSLNLAVVMRVLTLYALDVHPALTVPDEIKASVSRLLNEVLKLSRTTS